jgi:shikimate kinase
MVVPLGRGGVDARTARALPLLVELVGPAAAGKTTVRRALTRRSGEILIGVPPYYRRVADMPFFVKNGLLLMPMLLRLIRTNGRRLTRREIAWMAILQGWHSAVRERASSSSTAIVLDQGPVFLLARLFWLGPEGLRGQTAEKWRKSMYTHWTAALDLVVWLDASDAVLLERIRTRDKWHAVKDRSQSEALDFLSRYRAAYGQVMSALTANGGGPKVLRVDTARESLDGVVDRVLTDLGLGDRREGACVAVPITPTVAQPGAEQGL